MERRISMKLNRGMLVGAAVAAVAALGMVSVSVIGIDRAPDTDDPHVVAEMAAASSGTAVDSDTTSTAANPGVEQYAFRGGAVRGGGYHGAGYGRGWGGSSRFGRWGGGRYVGGRWVDGPYNGWCDGRYYRCNRAW
jgi:hypothetical protein